MRIAFLISTLVLSYISIQAAMSADSDPVVSVLKSIPSAAGVSVYTRLKTCKIRIQHNVSWLDTKVFDIPDKQIRAGDTVLQIIIDVPPLPGDTQGLYKDLTARWTIRNGKAYPDKGWAEQLQNKSRPIGSSAWMNC